MSSSYQIWAFRLSYFLVIKLCHNPSPVKTSQYSNTLITEPIGFHLQNKNTELRRQLWLDRVMTSQHLNKQTNKQKKDVPAAAGVHTKRGGHCQQRKTISISWWATGSSILTVCCKQKAKYISDWPSSQYIHTVTGVIVQTSQTGSPLQTLTILLTITFHTCEHLIFLISVDSPQTERWGNTSSSLMSYNNFDIFLSKTASLVFGDKTFGWYETVTNVWSVKTLTGWAPQTCAEVWGTTKSFYLFPIYWMNENKYEYLSLKPGPL